mgnify:CR=1 FL=1
MLPVLDAGMKNYAEVTAKVIGKDNQNAAGAGAAGGLGFAFLNYLDGELTPGIQLILNAVHVEDEMKDADVVVTGEGCLDHQTAMGKAPVGVAKLGKKYGAKTIAFAGSVTKEAVACNEAGIDAFFPIVRGISTLEEAMDPDTAKANMAANCRAGVQTAVIIFAFAEIAMLRILRRYSKIIALTIQYFVGKIADRKMPESRQKI